MVKITESLIRKKSEHNELIIYSLEEISLHQEDIEKIEHIHNWCRELKILLLQNNLISKIENLNKLKKLEYLNLALNNIEKIENLELLESLEKLDLTLNFVGELTSIESLRNNYNLESLILTGNPCTDFDGYRDYVIIALPQLQTLDGNEITISDRLSAQKHFDKNRRKIIQFETEYKIFRDEQKIRIKNKMEQEEIESQNLDEDEKNKKFWNTKSENCPEIRVEMANIQRKSRQTNDNNKDGEKTTKRVLNLFAKCGRPFSINEAKIEFTLVDEQNIYKLDLHVYKFMDTSLIDVDVQINYVRVTIKKKIFQMALNDEIKISESTTQRSMITGHLLIIMPKLNYKDEIKMSNNCVLEKNKKNKKGSEPTELKGTVNYKNIFDQIDESEVPPLI